MTEIKPYPWQERDQIELAKHNWVALLNIEVGGGKSFAACWAIQRSGSKVVLIVAPQPTFKTAWIPSVEKILGITAREIGNTGKAKKEALFDFEMGFEGVYLCSPQFLTRTNIDAWSGDMCIVDESHVLSAAGKAGQKKFSGYGSQAQVENSLAYKFPYRLALSGTAWRNNFERAWATARFLYPHKMYRGEVAYSNNFGWKAERMTHETIYTNQRDQYGNAKTAKKWLNEAVPGRLISEMDCVITHKRRETCCDEPTHQGGFLPNEEPKVTTHVIPLHPKQKKAFDELQNQYLTWLQGKPLIVDLPITMQIRLRQFALGVPTLNYESVTVIDDEGNEVEEVKESVEFEENCISPFTDELLERLKHMGDETALVWLDSQRFAEVLTKRLNKEGYPAFEYSGKTKKTREEDLSNFGPGLKYQIMVGVLSAASTGVDSIQHRTATEYWFQESTDITVNIQARGRTDRLGAKAQIDRHYFVDDFGYAQGKMDERLERQLALAKTLRKV